VSADDSDQPKRIVLIDANGLVRHTGRRADGKLHDARTI
jgi:hypothetical protein